jgi:hypothetical protein
MTLKLTPAAIAERCKIGQCFHCNDMYTNGHRDVCKQLFVMEVLVATDDQAPVTDTEDLTISLHALIGICPRSGCMMQLVVYINGARLNALLDSGSTHNFVDLDVVERAGINLMSQTGIIVVVAIGDRVHSLGSCRNMMMTIGSELFRLDCFGLALGSYDMVLGVHWLESLGPILWDFCSRTISFVRDGHGMLRTAIDTAAPAPATLAALDDTMEDLLLCFSSLFVESIGMQSSHPATTRDLASGSVAISVHTRAEG